MIKYVENKKILEDEKKLLLNELKKIGVVKNNLGIDGDYDVKNSNLNNDVNDVVDTAQNINNLRRNETIVTELETRLISVDSAIKRIENGKYGVCSVCNEKIDERRLNVNPAANTCIKHMDI